MLAPAVTLAGVTRTFGRHTALDGLDLSAPAGAITVLVGPNGAGKTTALRTITGALRPDGGVVTTLGDDPPGTETRRRIGVVAAKPALYDRLTGRDNLTYAAELYGRPDANVEGAAERFGIAYALAQRVAGYSTGMKTRLALARATLHDPDLLLLDEPTSGLDPESAHQVLDHIRSLTDKTVVVSTHLLLEAEGLADHLVFLEEGKAAAQGTPSELAAQVLPTTTGVIVETTEGTTVHEVDLDDVPDLVERLVRDGVRIRSVRPTPAPTLEEIYFALRRRT